MEATPEQAAEGLAIVQVLAAVLDALVVNNNTIAQGDPGQVTKFHAMKAPGISVLHYLERIHKYASCSKECFILALIYIDRLIQRNNFLVTDLNVHRVVITAILLAAKFFDDAYYNNAYYAKIGGVLVSEINGLEVDFLFRINFSLHVTPEEYEKYQAELWSQSSQAQAPAAQAFHAVPTSFPPSAMYQSNHSTARALAAPPAILVPPLRSTYVENLAPLHHQHTVPMAIPQITPSPPPEARRVENILQAVTFPPPPTMHVSMSSSPAALYGFQHEFKPAQRANSTPYPQSSSLTRCLPGGNSFEKYVSQFPQQSSTAQRLI